MRRARTASGGSEEAARDTSRPRTDDLEDGVPLPLLKHGIEVLRALATAAASTAERRVARKDINSKPPHGSWQALFDASKPSSLVARGYAAKGYGAGPDYGRYWITAAGLDSHVWKLARREGMPPFDSENPFDDGDVDDWSSDFDSEGSDDDDSDDDDSGGNSRSTQARNVVCRLAVYTGGSGRSKLGWTGLSAAFAAVDGRLVVLSEAENAKTVAACDG
ncbi:hypothetical protein AURANDRAFT_63419 [Aureococcus anophagefferens]|uniref:Uncharacterized protein n=1 Tax=Aureococcus anophagefferens TaxID=44056 RepID=F0Y6W1_AURAN|nr:hypothetical protein AURANDRAFT_63419 [Aureococcus anophagefferens]EGB08913.1 hypothetical protein AURANDRAFT_63419 [Aureococcus anophagefferens]|eukprot:XP_009036047.1 hypothetical protein AURANDRAFT_63419 [Aureococcus anophagefferens]